MFLEYIVFTSFSLLFIIILLLCICLFISIQVFTMYKNDSIEFMSLEELKEPRVKHIEGEEGYEW